MFFKANFTAKMVNFIFDGQKWVNHHFSGFIGRFLKSTSCKCPEFTAYHAIVSTEFLTWTSDAVTSGFWLVASAKLRLTFKLKSPGWLLLDGNAKPNNSWLRMEYKIMSSLNLTQFLRIIYRRIELINNACFLNNTYLIWKNLQKTYLPH